MPELPDIEIYREALDARLTGQVLDGIVLQSMFLLRSVDPPLTEFAGKKVTGFRRLGKRIVWCFEDDVFLVLHLMIAGRLHCTERSKLKPGAKLARNVQCAWDFPEVRITLTEAGSKRRASLHAVRGEELLEEHDPGGIDVLNCELDAFIERMTLRNHTLKRALTDPRLLSGIGNSFSDEILHRAQLSPVLLTQKMKTEQLELLLVTTREVLDEWTVRLRDETKGAFPKKVTAFRKEMAVHGKHKEPCPRCGGPVQRIAYASNETNYCPACQTGGKLLADRSMSRLMRKDWPKTVDELEALRERHSSTS